MTELSIDLPDVFYARVSPEGFARPGWIHYNTDLAASLELPGEPNDEMLAVLSGNAPFDGHPVIATVYAGHQFGHYVPQLGDGRAALIGMANGQELQLKGSGKTPYSRFADGKAVWRSSIREYLCSEAMHGLGIPTTRALSLIGSDEPVQRETWERAAMVCRVAPSFVRFGHFEFFAHTKADGPSVRLLADFVMRHHFPEVAAGDHAGFFARVVERTAAMIADWQAFGFCHGVMNTDNMSILGLTLDYGPFGFLERYEPGFVCNHSDESGRYSYEMQPRIGLWNLHALAYALASLIEPEDIEKALAAYWPMFAEQYMARMRARLGLFEREAGDGELVSELLALFEAERVDFSQGFRRLADWEIERWCATVGGDAARWAGRYHERLSREHLPEDARISLMKQSNPAYVLRNYLAEKAIRAAEDRGDFSEIARLFDLLQRPFDPSPELFEYAAPAPAGAPTVEVSCSS